jgi:hypothetical protein
MRNRSLRNTEQLLSAFDRWRGLNFIVLMPPSRVSKHSSDELSNASAFGRRKFGCVPAFNNTFPGGMSCLNKNNAVQQRTGQRPAALTKAHMLSN